MKAGRKEERKEERRGKVVEEREGKGRTLFIVFGWKVEGVEGRQSVGQSANYTTICKAKGESGGNGVGRTDWQAGKGGRGRCDRKFGCATAATF